MPILRVSREDRLWWQRGGFFSTRPSPGMVRLRRLVSRVYRERLTGRGRFLLAALAVFALLDMDTRQSQVFVLFAIAAGLFAQGSLLAFRRRPRLNLECRLPERATAGRAALAHVAIESRALSTQTDLYLRAPEGEPGAKPVSFEPACAFLDLGPGERARLSLRLTAPLRGRYVLGGAALSSTDPLRLVATRSVSTGEHVLLVYPRFYPLDDFPLPLGRRYQPGGIPLTSHLGDSIEFIATRPYREGDPLRSIHWRSWARHGEPVVKEYQEEYFARIALVLDTFLPARPSAAEHAGLEAAVSVLASIADYFSRSEYVVDILAAGPDVYEVSAGRSLAYLENVLDVLACLEPCHDAPFERIGPHLFEKLAQLTTVVAVMLDWDERRESFLSQVRAMGVKVHAIVVRSGETRLDWRAAAQELGVERLTPDDVERRLAAASLAG